jgi:hypothetical protein
VVGSLLGYGENASGFFHDDDVFVVMVYFEGFFFALAFTLSAFFSRPALSFFRGLFLKGQFFFIGKRGLADVSKG